MKYFITGATGFIGSFLVRLLLAQGHEVHAMVRSLEGQSCWRITDILCDLHIIKADLNNLDALISPLSTLKPDVICHLAWHGVDADARNSPDQILQNVPSTLKMLELCKLSGCPMFVALGSQAEYGIAEGIREECTPCEPATAYGIAKYALSSLAIKTGELSDLRVIWLRIFSVYGPKDDAKHLIPYLIRNLLAGTSPRLSAGGQMWDYLYVEDAVEAIASATRSRKMQGIYNLGSGQVVSLKKTIELTRDLIDPALPLRFGDLPYNTDQVMHLEANISRFQNATGWKPQVSLEDGLTKTVTWSKKQTFDIVD
jgi:UDP-glucose 4-epimerase